MAELRPVTIQPSGEFGELTDSDELVVPLSASIADPVIIPEGNSDNGIAMNATSVGFVLNGTPVINGVEFAGNAFLSISALSTVWSITNAVQINVGGSDSQVFFGTTGQTFSQSLNGVHQLQATVGEPTFRFRSEDAANVDIICPTTDVSVAYTLPAEDGVSGAALRTNGSGILRFDAPSGAAFPVSNLYTGREFFHTGFKQKYVYDGSVWLGPPRTVGWGRSGGTNIPGSQVLRSVGNVVSAANGGYPMGVDIKIICVEIFSDNTADPMSGSFTLKTSTGTTVYTRTLTTENSVREDQLDVDLSSATANGLGAEFNLTAGTINDATFLVTYCERRT